MVIRFLLIAICIFPSFSIARDTASCYQALTIWVDQKADMRTVIPALKIGADDGDEVCAAFLGVALSDADYARKENYVADLAEGFKYLKRAALNSERLGAGIKGDIFYRLGLAYFEGSPVLQNFRIAYSWFSLAAALGNSKAPAMRSRAFYLLGQSRMADGVQEFALRCKSSPILCLPE